MAMKWALISLILFMPIAKGAIRSKNLQLRIAELEARVKNQSKEFSDTDFSDRRKLADFYVLTGRCADALALLDQTPALQDHSAYCSCGTDRCKKK